MANKPEYQDISTLDTLNSVTETAWAPVVDKNKTGKKVDLSTIVPNSMQNFESVDELTTEQKAAFLGSAAVPACGTVETNGTKVTKSIPVSELVPANIVVDANYVHTDNNFTNSLKNKLNGIDAGAKVNVQSDWNETNSSSDAFIQNKPTVYSADDITIISTSASNQLTLKGFNNASTDMIPYKHYDPSSSTSKLGWKALNFKNVSNRSYDFIEGTSRHITYDDEHYFPLVSCSNVGDIRSHDNTSTQGDPFYNGTTAIFYFGNTSNDPYDGSNHSPTHNYALDFNITENHNIWVYTYETNSQKHTTDLTEVVDIQIIILRPESNTFVQPMYTNLIKIEPGTTNRSLPLNIAYIDIEPGDKAYSVLVDDEEANFTQLTCITTRKNIDTSKPGYIRITGDVFEIMQ